MGSGKSGRKLKFRHRTHACNTLHEATSQKLTLVVVLGQIYIIIIHKGVVTDIHNVLVAKTGHLDSYSKEGVESICFLLYIIGSKDKMCV